MTGTTPEQKRFDKLQAQFALTGHTLTRTYDVHTGHSKYYASRWGYIKPLADLAAVEAFLAQIGGAHDGD